MGCWRLSAVRAASKNERWGILTFEGIAGIVSGIIAMALPRLTVFAFVGLLAAWALTHRLIFIRPGDSLSQPSSVQQSYITPRLSDRHSLTFVEHGKVSDILFAILPNQIIVAQISSCANAYDNVTKLLRKETARVSPPGGSVVYL